MFQLKKVGTAFDYGILPLRAGYRFKEDTVIRRSAGITFKIDAFDKAGKDPPIFKIIYMKRISFIIILSCILLSCKTLSKNMDNNYKAKTGQIKIEKKEEKK